jgi:hypothetical protein
VETVGNSVLFGTSALAVVGTVEGESENGSGKEGNADGRNVADEIVGTVVGGLICSLLGRLVGSSLELFIVGGDGGLEEAGGCEEEVGLILVSCFGLDEG